VNREENHDGADYNVSWNCGIEGQTNDPEVERLRNRQVKKFLTLTLLEHDPKTLNQKDIPTHQVL
jgi:glycogen operon protein